MNASFCQYCECQPVIRRPVAHDLGKSDLFVVRCPKCDVFVAGKDEESAISLWNQLQTEDPDALWQVAMRRYYAE